MCFQLKFQRKISVFPPRDQGSVDSRWIHHEPGQDTMVELKKRDEI